MKLHFDPGFHSFYGRMNVEVIDRYLSLLGASLYPGYNTQIFIFLIHFLLLFLFPTALK
jgi:hypothetical protein